MPTGPPRCPTQHQPLPACLSVCLHNPFVSLLCRDLFNSQAAATYPPTATVVELRLVASVFERAAAAAAAAPISRFFAALPARRAGQAPGQAAGAAQQQQGVQAQQRQEVEERQQDVALQPAAGRQLAAQQQLEQHSGPGRGGAWPLQAVGSSKPGPPGRQSSADSSSGAACSSHGGGDDSGPTPDVDLDSVDLLEQQRILRQIEQQQQQQQRPAPHQRQSGGAGGGRSGGGAGGRKRGVGKGAPAPDAKQPKILGFLKR